jgi:hypothetical protein
VLPQQVLPLVAQNGLLPVVQQTWLVVEQQGPPVPHCAVPLAQPEEFAGVCAGAGLIPNAARMPPATVPLSSLSARRRGAGVARMRAISSKREFTVQSFRLHASGSPQIHPLMI